MFRLPSLRGGPGDPPAGRPRGSPGDARRTPGDLGVLGDPWGALGTPWPPWEYSGFPEDTCVSLKIHGRGDLRVPGYPWDSFGGIRRDRDPHGCLGSPPRSLVIASDPWGYPGGLLGRMGLQVTFWAIGFLVCTKETTKVPNSLSCMPSRPASTQRGNPRVASRPAGTQRGDP